jgi:hypothetical protein
VDIEQFRAVDRAFREGNLRALRAAVNDDAVIPNGEITGTGGSCLTCAIYWSPIPFIRELLESGADPSRPASDGFLMICHAAVTSDTLRGPAEVTL